MLLVLIVDLDLPALLKLLLEETALVHLSLQSDLPALLDLSAMLEPVLHSPQRPTELLALLMKNVL